MKKVLLLAILFCLNVVSAQEEVNLSSLDLVANKEQIRKVKKGDNALVYFWAVWCKDCKKSLKTTLGSLHEKGVPIFAINRDRKAKKVKHHIKKYSIKIPIYRDESKMVSKKLKAFSVPHWAVVRSLGDNNFSILKVASGEMSDALSYFEGAE